MSDSSAAGAAPSPSTAEMVRRLAKAMAEVTYNDCDKPVSLAEVLDKYFGQPFGFILRDALLEKAARAAIEAMREPTEAMWDAGASIADRTTDTWHAMIDAALK